MASLTFIGAARTTTGSKHLLEWQGENRKHRILVDCGLFQGLKRLRRKNWDSFPVAAELLDAVILTHAHLDHCGYLPKLVREGFDGVIYGTAATIDLAEVILRDSAHIQEEDARLAKKFGWSKHKDPKPLYTAEDVENTIPLMKPLPYYRSTGLNDSATVRLHHSGHILGSSFVEVIIEENGHPIRVVFSGDVGRYDQPLLLDPEPPSGADYLLLEGTYGNRTHDTADPKLELSEVIARTVKRGGTVVIPSFALGRSQQLLYYIAELLEEEKIPKTDIFLDSPMAVKVTKKTQAHFEELDAETLAGMREQRIFRRPEVHLLTTREQSQELNGRTEPCIIISASGMASAGRILHHLERRLPNPKCSVLLVGYQAEGTRGRRLLNGEKEIKIHGRMVPVSAEVLNMSSLSAHADWTEMRPWLRRMAPPARTYLVHGEVESLEAMQDFIGNDFGWDTYIPELGETVSLEPVEPAKAALRKDVSEKETAESIAIKGARLIVNPGNIAAPLPAGWEEATMIDSKADGDLAKRIIAEMEAEEILYILEPGCSLFAQPSPETRTFINALRDDGRKVWLFAAA